MADTSDQAYPAPPPVYEPGAAVNPPAPSVYQTAPVTSQQAMTYTQPQSQPPPMYVQPQAQPQVMYTQPQQQVIYAGAQQQQRTVYIQQQPQNIQYVQQQPQVISAPTKPGLNTVQPMQGVGTAQLHIINEKPNAYTWQAWLTCLCCFWPTGIVAIIKSMEVDDKYRQGNVVDAKHASKQAKMFSWISFGLGFGSWFIGLILIIVYATVWSVAVSRCYGWGC